MTGEHSDLQRGLLAPPSSLRFGSKRLAGIAGYVLAASSIAAILVSRTWAIVAVAFIAARDPQSSSQLQQPQSSSQMQMQQPPPSPPPCARQIWVIRHGEKSPHPAPGSPEVHGLNATGWSRASHLARLVESGHWPRFVALFASDPGRPPFALREVQTVQPLAALLGLPVNDSFAQSEGEQLAAAALLAARDRCGAVLLSWEHCRIPALLRALGCGAEHCLRCWPDGEYDRVERVELLLREEPSGAPAWRVRAMPPAAEGFGGDVEGYRGYECVDPAHVATTRCVMPDGTELRPPLRGEAPRVLDMASGREAGREAGREVGRRAAAARDAPRGEPALAAPRPPFDCLTREAWGGAKRAWCCAHERLGCAGLGAALAEGGGGLAPPRLETGDLVFVRPAADASELDKAILATGAATVLWWRSHGVNASNETAWHVALAQRDASGALHFVEATPPAVVVTPAADFWRRASHATLYAGRLVGARMRALGAAATQAASAQAGTPYASDFEPPPAKFYCSSLVEWAFGVAAGEKSVFLPPGLTFKLLFEPLGFWERYYHGLNQSLPVNVSGSNPTLLLHSPAVRFTTLRPEDVVANL